jgi:hypothetical protein
MAKSNGNSTEENYENVVIVAKTTDLPYAYLPYDTIRAARVKYPDEKLYVYEGQAPAGYKIVAVPILMQKPEEDDNE